MLGWTVIFMSLCVIGVHGMLSGTASMDFGGKKNAGGQQIAAQPSSLMKGLLRYNGCVRGTNTKNCFRYPDVGRTRIDTHAISQCGVRGYDGAKKVKGRKRQVMVDTDGRAPGYLRRRVMTRRCRAPWDPAS